MTVPELHRTRMGDAGPRVVFLHGLFGQGRNWTGIAKGIAAQARTTLVDLPDHGRSGWSSDFSYREQARAVAAALEADSPGEPYAVVGHSMGGKVAMTLALARPELVDRLCVVDVSPVRTSTITSFDDYIRGMRAIDLATLTDRTSAEAQLAPLVPDPTIRSFLLQNLRRDPHQTPAWRWQSNLDLLAASLPAIADWPDPEAAPFEGPVLWLAGATSGYVRPGFAPAMRALFPRVRLVSVKGAGHWVHSDQPQIFTAILRRFLGLGE